MSLQPTPIARIAAWSTVSTLVANDGSGAHPYVIGLGSNAATMRDLADAVHFLCILHGRHPSVVDHAGRRAIGPAVAWLDAASDGFAVERALLATLVSVAGPLPSTPGQAEAEAAVIAQHHAIEMLAQSDRTGCALGAAVAAILDWAAIRAVLDRAAMRLGARARAVTLPASSETAALIEVTAETPGIERAIGFGAQQLLAQHRGLWDLLEARASARAML